MHDLLETATAVFLQETRGAPADLTQLPPSHEYVGAFAEIDADSANSRSGGVVIGLRREVWQAARRVVAETLARGRVLRLSLLLDRWVHLVNVHVDPALPLSVRRRLLRRLADAANRCQDMVLIGGDWNFVAGGDARERLDAGKTREDEGMNGLFDDLFSNFAEMMQNEMTFRRLPRDVGGSIVFSRIDRIYANLHYAAISQLAASIGVRGQFAHADAPSDHRAVVMTMRPRTPPPAPRIDGRVCSADAFSAIVSRELAGFAIPTCPRAHVEVLRGAALRVAADVRLSMLSDATARNSALAEVCLRALRSGARGRWDQARRQLDGYSDLRDLTTGDEVEMQSALQLRLRTYIDANTLQALRMVERSKMPEQHKSAKRSSIRRRQEKVRLHRRRHVLEGIYDDQGSLILDPVTAGEALARHWQLVFAESVMNDSAMSEFLGYVQLSPMHDWEWPRGAWLSTMAGIADTTAGPDGLPYSLWRDAPRSWTLVLDEMAERATAGEPLPRWTLESSTVCIPKGEFHEDAARVVRQLAALRLITLIDEHGCKSDGEAGRRFFSTGCCVPGRHAAARIRSREVHRRQHLRA